MDNLTTTTRTFSGSIGIGLIISLITAVIMIAMLKSGIAPFPEAPSLAFAEKIIGHKLPMPIGLLFHTAYVTFWTVVFLRFSPQKNIKMALALAVVLWLVVLGLFFPVIGWGFAGLSISPKMIPASFMPHLIFGLLLWGINKYAFQKRS